MTLKSEDKKKKSFIPRIFSAKEKKERILKEDPSYFSVEFERDTSFSFTPSAFRNRYSEIQSTPRVENSNISGLASPMSNVVEVQPFRVFVATWNVGGKAPHSGLNLDKLLQVREESDIYVLGFQEIVPLNAGNVLVIEDSEPAAKWLALINQALNKSPAMENFNSPMNNPSGFDASFSSQTSNTRSFVARDVKSPSNKMFFQKPSLRTVSKSFRTESKRRLKTCNCPYELERKNSKDSCFKCQMADVSEDDSSSEDEDGPSYVATEIPPKYGLVASKKMVGIFVTVWAKTDIVQHINHLRISCVGRGIMGYLGNKGCISVSMSLYRTSLCFVCSHLASGEKEGDELRRNSDVIEILRNTQFRKICKFPSRRIPEKILEHDRIIWLGDLNYRIALSYMETRKFLEDNDWDSLLKKDQLKIEKDAGRVFQGWKEGRVYFGPTYKYSNNSDVYAGETITSKKKRRTPAWCDRILWHGNGIKQLSYIRGESRFSDHRPVCAVFVVEVGVIEGRSRKELSNSNVRIEVVNSLA